jgi:hypothetical protein
VLLAFVAWMSGAATTPAAAQEPTAADDTRPTDSAGSAPAAAAAEPSLLDDLDVSFDAFVDVYYAYDFNEPRGRERAFTTQPLRHDEFNVNFAFIRAQATGERVRGSFGFGLGTYVQANYAAEPEILQNVFEAYAGVKLGDSTWLDAGVMPSHIGLESAISSQNWTLTRSLVADFSPFYETGVRLGLSPSEHVSATFLVLNGFQTIRETNDHKAVGAQLQVRPSDRVVLNYSNYLSDEAPDDESSQVRFFHDLFVTFSVTDAIGLAAVFDVGTQERPDDDSATWYGTALIARYAFAPGWAVAARGEVYHDPDQVLVVTGTPDGFQTAGASLNLDYAPAEGVLMRIEGRLLDSEDEVFPSETDDRSDRDPLLTTSIAFTF